MLRLHEVQLFEAFAIGWGKLSPRGRVLHFWPSTPRNNIGHVVYSYPNRYVEGNPIDVNQLQYISVRDGIQAACGTPTSWYGRILSETIARYYPRCNRCAHIVQRQAEGRPIRRRRRAATT